MARAGLALGTGFVLVGDRYDGLALLVGLGERLAEHKITKLDELMPWRYAEASA